MRTFPLAAALIAALALAACGPPIKNTPIAEIPNLTSLEEVMDNQATVADPQFGKAKNDSFSDEDYAAFSTMAERIGATSLKTKELSGGKGADFEALAMKLHDQAEALGKAAGAKDKAAAATALTDMKATCKECHSKFR